jgi:peptide/nickel transport system permease protein
MKSYIVKRLIVAVVTLFFVSILTFIIVQLPPGDYLTTYIARLSQSGQTFDDATVEALKIQFGLDRPAYVQYLYWLKSMLTGNFGFSFEWRVPVRDLIGERILLTLALTFLTMAFTWIFAFAIGLYSATHQYSIGDYAATFFGFIGVSVPHFLFAMILMWAFFSKFGISLGGLFSREYINKPWSFGRFMDMIKHMIWPVFIIGLSNIAFLLRTIRANMLDEVTKPYVTAAKAKGVPSMKLILKYPFRVAILPFVSTIGWQVPNIINAQVIAGVVLSLPILGPLLLNSLVNQDMFLAGTIIIFLSLLTILGTLVSDLLLAWVDPRIVYK